MADTSYEFGKPDKYDGFPYLYLNSNSDPEKFNRALLERLPENYNMQIVDSNEEQVLSDLSTLGIDSHLEAMTMNQADRIEDRKVGDKVFCRHHAFDFSPTGMICLIRRLKEYNPNDFHTFEGCEPSEECPEESQEERDMWEAAYNLRSAILQTLDIEDSGA